MSQTVIGVPILETGMEYPASTGPITLTDEDLISVVESQGDPAIVSPRLKLGHDDPRFNGPIAGWDGEPAFGIAQNLRLDNNGQTVLCDYVGVPDWLAEVLPAAYPNRSVEGNWDVETVTGHKWRFVVSDVALLGVIWPGISTLDDLQAALSDEGPEGVEVTASKTPAEVAASTNLEDVRRFFYDEIATRDTGRFWWWVRAVLLDPNELIVDDDDGGLYRVPFSLNGDEITFEDPIPVKIEYVDAPVAARTLAAVRATSAVYATSQDSRPETRVKENPVTDVNLELLRSNLGLSEDATEEQINEALARAESGEQEPESNESTGGESTGGEQEPNEQQQQQVAASGAVTVDTETLTQLRRDAELGRSAYEAQRVKDRDSFLLAAVSVGKFPPARLNHWTEAWEKDPEGIKAAIESMPAGLIPVSMMGGTPNEENGQTEAYPKGWLPELNRQTGSTITQEA